MNNIRLTYSGLISFIVLLISIITGLVFTLIVTRKLSQEEFGLWSLIGSLLVYALVFEPINTYWTTRQVARNESVTITSLSGAMIFSVIATIMYVIIITILSKILNVNFEILLFSAILLPLLYLRTATQSVLAGFRPQGISYGMLVFESVKIPIGFILVYWADFGIVGAILTTAIAHGSSSVYYLLCIKQKFGEKFSTKLFKDWLKLSWLPIFSSSYNRILNIDSSIFTGFSGSVVGLSYVGVSKTIGNFVATTSSIASALSPKLIITQKSEYIEYILRRTLFFTIPAFGFVIIFAVAGLWILNPVYVNSESLVYLWAIIFLTEVFQGIFASSLVGLEKVDIGFRSNVSDYLKSKLFKVPLIYTIGHSVYIGLLVIIIIFSNNTNMDVMNTLQWWGIVGVIANSAIAITFYFMTRRNVKFSFPVSAISKYTLATILSVIISYFSINQFLVYDKSIFVFIPNVIPHILLFTGIYAITMWIIDNDTRLFFKQILKEFKK